MGSIGATNTGTKHLQHTKCNHCNAFLQSTLREKLLFAAVCVVVDIFCTGRPLRCVQVIDRRMMGD
jgi:hypothetical protein